jgi:hypothetical protein
MAPRIFRATRRWHASGFQPPPPADDAYTTQLIGEVGVQIKNRWTPAMLAKSCAQPRLFTSIDTRIVILTLLNALLYWPWHWLRVAYDEGNHHPSLVLSLLALTLWAWSQLIVSVIHRIRNPSN